MQNFSNNNFEQENVQPQDNNPPPQPAGYKIPYDGGNVVSSHPFTTYQEPDANNNVGPQSNQPQPAPQQPAENQTIPDPAILLDQNKRLTEQLNNYQQALSQILINQNKAPQNIIPEADNKPPTDLDQRLDDVYNRARNDSVQEAVKAIESNRIAEEKIEYFRKQNPDIAADTNKEIMVSFIAEKYMQMGLGFENSISKAIQDFRKVFNYPQQPDNKPQNQVPQSTQVNKSSSTSYSPNSYFIEGASAPLPEKQFTAHELRDMQINRPDEYLRLQPQIMRAYREGKVILD